ncbi:MAG: PH domain-containing protein [Acidimicrobiia bacterium]
MGYPRRLLSTDEVVVTEFRPHWSRILKELALSVLVAVMLILLATLFDFSAKGWVMLGIGVVWLLVVIRGLLAWWFTGHVITNERVIYRAGIFSRHGKEIPLEVINDVSFKQTPWERMIGSGDLVIESAGEMGQSYYEDIPRPQEIQTVIYKVRETRMLHIEGGGSPRGTISKAEQLQILARLHDEGKLTDDEFEAEKRNLS